MAKLSRDQKRKKKLEERNRRARQQPSLAYDGSKYHTVGLEPLWLQTEAAIYEAFLRSERRLDDETVVAAVEYVILKLRAGTLPPPSTECLVDPDQRQDLVIYLIQRNWQLMDEQSRRSRDDKIGVLRSILGTLELKREAGPVSRAYLRYIETFLKDEVRVMISADEKFEADLSLPLVDTSFV